MLLKLLQHSRNPIIPTVAWVCLCRFRSFESRFRSFDGQLVNIGCPGGISFAAGYVADHKQMRFLAREQHFQSLFLSEKAESALVPRPSSFPQARTLWLVGIACRQRLIKLHVVCR